MKDDIVSYREMCDLEGVQTLQRGMNYRLNPPYSVILMSQRSNAPYQDEILEDGLTILYEGHDCSRISGAPDPKTTDQPIVTKSGKPTQNGKFVNAVREFAEGGKPAQVKVYEKLFDGVWSFRGLFNLVGYEYVKSGQRRVFKFRLELDSMGPEFGNRTPSEMPDRRRIIPTHIKKMVWERDKGRCVKCGATDELHFDHDIPFSKGGTSISADNVKILCARHNLSKGARIE